MSQILVNGALLELEGSDELAETAEFMNGSSSARSSADRTALFARRSVVSGHEPSKHRVISRRYGSHTS
jgi:hypothetical protein